MLNLESISDRPKFAFGESRSHIYIRYDRSQTRLDRSQFGFERSYSKIAFNLDRNLTHLSERRPLPLGCFAVSLS